VHADVTQARGPEESVDDRVNQYVRVRMTFQSEGMIDVNSPENQRSSVNQLVDIESLAYSHDLLLWESSEASLVDRGIPVKNHTGRRLEQLGVILDERQAIL
jgi:hypothetical protein